jgi:hypothetical protein
VVWVDLHVTPEATRWLRSNYTANGQTNIPVSACKDKEIGNLDRDDDPNTDELFDLK